MVVHRNGSMYVHSSTLKKLLCSLCKKYLSYPPIYRHLDQGPVCGRCFQNKTENFFHDELFEHSIEFQKFPCIYYEKGCLEYLFPHQVPQHEKTCHYLELNCPLKVYNNCLWQGRAENVLEHFENQHPAFIIRDGRFELDFVNNHKENYIMTFAEEIYVIERECNLKNKCYTISVSFVGIPKSSHYTYLLSLEAGNQAYKHQLSQNIGEKLEIQGDNILEILHDPVTIIANISIQEIFSEPSFISSDEDYSNPDLDYDQLSVLECPVCFYYMVPPIFQCERGHSICNNCKEKQSECPTCRGTIGNAKNYVLENLVNKMIYPCKHSGCKFTTKVKYIREHEAYCLFGPLECPLKEYEDCTTTFSISELYSHIKNIHYESLIELDTVSIPIENDIEEDIEESYIISLSEQLIFKVCFKYSHEDEFYLWSVQLVGPPEQSDKYKYEMDIVDNSGNNNRLYLKANCSPLTSREETFKNDANFVCLLGEQISKFIKYQLTYRIRIISITEN